MKTAMEMIHEERVRQVFLGYNAVHDDTHTNGELAQAAVFYASDKDACRPWPFEPESCNRSESPIRNLVKAGALIVAEIERLRRRDFVIAKEKVLKRLGILPRALCNEKITEADFEKLASKAEEMLRLKESERSEL